MQLLDLTQLNMKSKNYYFLKRIIWLSLTIFLFISCGEKALNEEKQILTAYDIAGTYEFGSDQENESVGLLKVYPLSSNKALFYVQVCIGPPAYNLGDIFGEISSNENNGEFYLDESNTPYDCKFKFNFTNKEVKIITENDCSFGGNGVSVDYTFFKKNNRIPSNFTNYAKSNYLFDEVDVKSYYSGF